MNRFQAIPSSEVTRLRSVSAERFADLFLRMAAGQIREMGGDVALESFRRRISGAIGSLNHVSIEDDRLAELAVEELERAIQVARDGQSPLRGWTEDAPPAVEELKP